MTPMTDHTPAREEAVTPAMVNAAWNEAKSRRMTGLPTDFRAVLEAAVTAAAPAREEAWPECLAEHLAERHKRLMLETEREAFQAAQSGDKARQSLASTESERHRAVYHAMCLIMADENRRRVAPAPAVVESAQGVKVKALEWLSHAWGCEADGGRYRIEDNGTNWTDDRYWLFVNVGLLTNHRSKYDTLDTAKAAAQADFEARIRASLATEQEG